MIDGGMKFGKQSSGVGMSGGPTEPTAASTDTEEPFLVGASSAVAVQAVVAANCSDLGGGGSSVQMSQRRRSRVARIRREVFWVWLPENEAEKDAASGFMHDVAVAEYASGGGMMSGGQSS